MELEAGFSREAGAGDFFNWESFSFSSCVDEEESGGFSVFIWWAWSSDLEVWSSGSLFKRSVSVLSEEFILSRQQELWVQPPHS